MLKLSTCLLYLIIQQVTSLSISNVTINVPPKIVVLTQDVTAVVRRIPTGRKSLEVYYENETALVAAQIFAQHGQNVNTDEVTLVFDCGYFSRIGNYNFKIRDLDTGEILDGADSQVVAYKQPNIELKMKSFHEALTTDVKVSVTLPRDICISGLALKYRMQLVMLRDNSDVVASHDVTFPPTSIVFYCRDFSQPGNYVAQLRMAHRGSDAIVKESDVMEVDWSSDYSLQLPKKIFPCSANLVSIKVMRPPCVPHDDVIQAIAMFNDGSYRVISNATIGSSDDVTFSCSLLEKSVSPGICFRYLTSQETTRIVCRKRSKHLDFNVNGGWSGWSYWDICKRSCTKPIHRRIRTCDNPQPQGRGSKCPGESTPLHQYQLQTDSDQDSSCPLSAGAKVSNITPSCGCNCIASNCSCLVPSLESCLLTSPISGEVPSANEMIWKLYTPVDCVLRLQVVDMQMKDVESLTARDRGGLTYLFSQSQVMTSSFSILTLRYMRSTSEQVTDSCGFVLFLRSLEKSLIVTTSSPTTSTRQNKPQEGSVGFINNPVLIGSVVACLLVILIVAVVSILRCRKQRTKERTRLKVETCSQQRLTTPPDGKSSSNIDTESERPITIGAISRCGTDAPTTPKLGVAYYLAQRQLQLMKKEGKENSSQVYAAACVSDDSIREQATLLFGNLDETLEVTT